MGGASYAAPAIVEDAGEEVAPLGPQGGEGLNPSLMHLRAFPCPGRALENFERKLVPDGKGGFDQKLINISGRHLPLDEQFLPRLQAARDMGLLLSMPPYLDGVPDEVKGREGRGGERRDWRG